MSLYEYEREGDAQELIGALRRSENQRVRKRAAEMLGGLEDHDDRDDIINALVQTANEDDGQVAAAAIDALNQLGQDALEQLLTTMAGVDVDGTEVGPGDVTRTETTTVSVGFRERTRERVRRPSDARGGV